MPSHRSLSISILLCLLLTGCKVNVSVLGQGSVNVITANIPACAAAAPDLCLNAGYNRAVELQALPAEGYLFAGWAGDCSGTGNCTVRTLGDRHAVAVFRKAERPGVAITPLMRYIDDFFFSGPWPSDIRRKKDGTLDLDDYPVGKGAFPSSAKNQASRQHGFARNGSLYIPLENQLTPDFSDEPYTVFTHGNPQETIQLVNLDTSSPQYLRRIPLRIRLTTSNRLETGAMLQLEPELGHTLQAGATYGIVMFAGPTGTYFPLTFAGSNRMQSIIDQGAQGLLGQHWQQVQAFVTQHTPFTPADVAAFSVFTTQTGNPDYAAVKEFIDAQNLEMDINIRLWGTYGYPACPNHDPDSTSVTLRHYNAALPNILSGKPPYLLSGGKLNRNSGGLIEATDTPVHTDIVIALPCAAPAANEKRPVEIHSLPTAYEIDEYWLEYLSVHSEAAGTNKAIRVFIAAPHTNGRIYSSGYQSLDLLTRLTGIESEELAIVLGDFNPFNMGAIEPQYLQYAMEILYVKAALRQIYDWGIEEQAWLDPLEYEFGGTPQFIDFSNAHPDFNDITLVGTSLGGLSTLHANAIDPTHRNLVLSYMPRPSAWHINDLWDYLDSWLSQDSKKLLANALGVQLPIAPGDPLLGLLQTAIDRIDPNSLIEHTRHQNTLLVLAEFDNALHGRHASYSVASAIDRQFGLIPLWRPSWGESDFPFRDYVRLPLQPTEYSVRQRPARVLLPLPFAENSVLSFSTQMRAGNGFTWVE